MRYCEVCRAAFQERRTCPRDDIPTRADLVDPLLGAVLGERYRVLDHLASGGMGQVYRAAHTRIASLFAVKVLYGDLAYDEAMRARFEREAEVASLLQSRYIVRVVDFSQSDSGLLYLAMEHLAGDTLADLVRRAGRLEPRRALELAVQVARGLAHAHERGVVHRDLKSENVMVIREDDAEVAKVLDFGVARLRHSTRVTGSRTVLGTPAFMSPEQFAGDDVDGRTDLYALGVTLHELLTGALPFESDNPLDLMRRHLTAPPPPLAPVLGASPLVAGLEGLSRGLLAKRKEDRFASARAFVEAARRVLEPASAPASAPTPSQTAQPSAANRAGPPVDRALLAAIWAAIELGAPAYNAGDHARCYALYRQCVEAALSGQRTPPLGLAERARLLVAHEQAAAAPGPTRAAWTLRHAFDELASAAPISALPVRDAVDAALDVFQAVAARTYALGRADVVAPLHVRFATLLRDAAAQLATRQAELPALDRALTAARASKGDVVAAVLSETFERLRQPYTPSIAHSLPTAPTRLGPPAAAISDLVRDAILRAIRHGVPAYNAGDHAGCAREYQLTADAVVGECARDPGSAPVAAWLGSVADRARVASPHDAAWMLRHAFDALLALPR
ncbi:MAG TPA: serine/threonine-protein kinase [Polyangiaceae bacterium]|nr:serine/threonine-protein kinase [Polyangiaceae bacterium]